MSQLQGTRNSGNNSNKINKFQIIEKKLHPAGGIIQEHGLVYEPLGNYNYIYNFDGLKGITTARLTPEKEWTIEIADRIYHFQEKPLKKLLFSNIPPEELIQDYINDIYPVKSGEMLINELITFFKVVLDLLKEQHYYHPTIIVLQSWLREILDSVFYIGFEAKFGAGKTKALEALAILCHHGWLVGDITQAGISRLISSQKLSPFVDELDTVSGSKDNEVYRVFRLGYRKNNPYVRLKERTYEAEVCDILGTKGYTFSSNIERALKQRSLITPMRKTNDKKLPIIDIYIQNLGKRIAEDLFFWYLENIIEAISLLPSLPSLPLFSQTPQKKEDIQMLRNSIYNEIINGLNQEEKDFLNEFTGRNTELSFNVILISKIFKVDLIKNLIETFKEKEELDSIYDENTLLLVLKELLKEIYEENKNKYLLDKGDFQGCFYYPKNECYDRYRTRLKSKDLFPIGNDKFVSFLKEIGFQDNINIKRERFENKNLLCLIFDRLVLNELDIQEDSDKDINNTQQYQQHVITLEEDALLYGINIIPEEIDSKNYQFLGSKERLND